MCTLDLLAVNYNSQLTQTQTLWLPLHLNKVTFCYSVGTKSISILLVHGSKSTNLNKSYSK